jgi:hypothetical protein
MVMVAVLPLNVATTVSPEARRLAASPPDQSSAHQLPSESAVRTRVPFAPALTETVTLAPAGNRRPSIQLCSIITSSWGETASAGVTTPRAGPGTNSANAPWGATAASRSATRHAAANSRFVLNMVTPVVGMPVPTIAVRPPQSGGSPMRVKSIQLAKSWNQAGVAKERPSSASPDEAACARGIGIGPTGRRR